MRRNTHWSFKGLGKPSKLTHLHSFMHHYNATNTSQWVGLLSTSGKCFLMCYITGNWCNENTCEFSISSLLAKNLQLIQLCLSNKYIAKWKVPLDKVYQWPIKCEICWHFCHANFPLYGMLIAGQLNHSYAMSCTPLNTWITMKKSGTFTCGHCTCMAGLGEDMLTYWCSVILHRI